MLYVVLVLTAMLVVLSTAYAKTHCHFDRKQYFLDCRSRGFMVVPSNNQHFTDAVRIDLSFNDISVIRNCTFVNVTELEFLDLSDNVINTLHSSAFTGLKSLTVLNLSRNHIPLTPDVFTPELFNSLVNLREIRILGSKKPGYLEWKGVDAAFAKLTNLTSLALNLPKDFVFGNGFRRLSKLKTLYSFGKPGTEDCDLVRLRNSTFEALRGTHLKELHLIHCDLMTIEPDTFEPLISLEVLDLTYNNALGLRRALKSLYGLRDRNMSEIRIVRVNDVSCADIDQYILQSSDFIYLQTICVKTVDFSQNYIFDIDDSFTWRSDCLERFNISFHSFRCEPTDMFTSFLKAKNLKSVDLSHGFGVPPSYVINQSYVPSHSVRRLSHDAFTVMPLPSNVIIPLPSTLITLNITAVAVWVNLASRVTFLSGANMRVLDAAFIQLDNCTGTKVYGLDHLTTLDISGIICDVIHPEYFLHIRRLTKLSLSNSPRMNEVLTSPTLPFVLLDLLEDIDLSGNRLTDIHPELFRSNRNLCAINLSNNKFHHIPSAVLSMTRLQFLDLSGNAYTHLLQEEITLIDKWISGANSSGSFQLLLGENPLQCTCDTILFIGWILQRKPYLDHQGNYICLLSNGSRIFVHKFGENLVDFRIKCVSKTYLIISVVGSLSFIVFTLLSAGIYRYRLNLRYWLYTKLKPPEHMFIDQDYEYDVFVAYTNENYEWVFRQLRPHLEMIDNPIHLCLHQRDFIPGKPIHENIVEMMRGSKKILLIISMAFLNSTYGPLEITEAYWCHSKKIKIAFYVVITR